MHWLEVSEFGMPERSGFDRADLSPLARVARLGSLLEAFQHDILEPFNVVPSDYGVLVALWRTGPPYALNPTQLYDRLQRSSGGMTKILRRLEAARLIERAPDPEDGRGSRVLLTPRGQSLHQRIDQAFAAATSTLMGAIDADDKRMADRSLSILLAAFEDRVRVRSQSEAKDRERPGRRRRTRGGAESKPV